MIMVIKGPDIYVVLPLGQELFSEQSYEAINIIIFMKQSKQNNIFQWNTVCIKVL